MNSALLESAGGFRGEATIYDCISELIIATIATASQGKDLQDETKNLNQSDIEQSRRIVDRSLYHGTRICDQMLTPLLLYIRYITNKVICRASEDCRCVYRVVEGRCFWYCICDYRWVRRVCG